MYFHCSFQNFPGFFALYTCHFFFNFSFWDMVSLCSSVWPPTLTLHPPFSASQLVRLQMYTTTPALRITLLASQNFSFGFFFLAFWVFFIVSIQKQCSEVFLSVFHLVFYLCVCCSSNLSSLQTYVLKRSSGCSFPIV